MIKNYHDVLVLAGQDVQNNMNGFLDTFAPEGHRPDYELGFGIFLTLLQAPFTALTTFYWKGSEY